MGSSRFCATTLALVVGAHATVGLPSCIPNGTWPGTPCIWPSTPPEGCPFPPSSTFSGVSFSRSFRRVPYDLCRHVVPISFSRRLPVYEFCRRDRLHNAGTCTSAAGRSPPSHLVVERQSAGQCSNDRYVPTSPRGLRAHRCVRLRRRLEWLVRCARAAAVVWP